MSEICQQHLPYAPWMEAQSRRLPGVRPIEMADWLQVDDVYARQMAERARLLSRHRDAVLRLDPTAQDMADELLELVLQHLPALGFELRGDTVMRPDGETVTLGDPLWSLGHLVQEDFVLLRAEDGAHVMRGAVLCFPASWRLGDKFGHPLGRIHDPVAVYDDPMNRRVERLFTAARPGRPMVRNNALRYATSELFLPRPRARRDEGRYIRSERQTILRLPRTGGAVFSIHTYLVREKDLSPAQSRGLAEHPIATGDA